MDITSIAKMRFNVDVQILNYNHDIGVSLIKYA